MMMVNEEVRIFTIKKIVDKFIQDGGTDLKELDNLTNSAIMELSKTYNISENIYRAYAYQYFVEQTMYEMSKTMRSNKRLSSDIVATDINTIHRFCCKSKDAEKNMYDKLQNLHHLKTFIVGGELC